MHLVDDSVETRPNELEPLRRCLSAHLETTATETEPISMEPELADVESAVTFLDFLKSLLRVCPFAHAEIVKWRQRRRSRGKKKRGRKSDRTKPTIHTSCGPCRRRLRCRVWLLLKILECSQMKAMAGADSKIKVLALLLREALR